MATYDAALVPLSIAQATRDARQGFVALVGLIAPSPPVFGSFSPAAGSVARAAAVSFTVTDADGFSRILVWAVLADGSSRMVYTGSAFTGDFDAASTISGTTTKTVSVKHDGAGWTDDYTLHVLAIDSDGASATASSAYTLSDPPDPPDTTAPEIGSPTPSTSVKLTRGGEWEVTVTDDEDLDLVEIFVLYAATGDYEVAYDGEAFAPRYVAKSTRTNVSGGYRFKLIRTGGWPAHPTFKVRARDAANNEA